MLNNDEFNDYVDECARYIFDALILEGSRGFRRPVFCRAQHRAADQRERIQLDWAVFTASLR